MELTSMSSLHLPNPSRPDLGVVMGKTWENGEQNNDTKRLQDHHQIPQFLAVHLCGMSIPL